MPLRTAVSLILVCSLLSPALVAQGKNGSPPGKIKPYSLSVSALKGSEVTDVCITIVTNDPGYPVPETLKKLTIKSRNQAGDVISVRHYADATVTGGQVCLEVADLPALTTLEVQALVQTKKTVNTEVLYGSATVLFRPDLIVERVNAPDQSAPGVPFSIEIVVEENKFQTGATADVSLYEGANLLGFVPGVIVDAGGQVSVYFTGLVFPDPGTYDLTVRIDNAAPAEYDETNNAYAFSIEVAEAVVSVPYVLDYYHEKNIDLLVRNTVCGTVEYEETHAGSRGEWSYHLTLPFETESPIDSIRWQSISGGGTLTQGIVTNLAATQSFPIGDLYSLVLHDPDGSTLFLDVFVNRSTHQTAIDMRKLAGDYVIVVTAGGETNIVEQQASPQLNLEDFLEVRVLFADDGRKAGGAGSIAITPYETVTDGFADSFEADGCVVEFLFTHTFDFSTGHIEGETDPTRLPSTNRGRQQDALTASSTPLHPDVVQTYPNPFNPSATVQFTVQETGLAVLKIYNMVGKEVAELFRGEAEGGKTYRFTFHAGDYASGMYYARLEAAGRQYTRKMILMK